MKKKSYVACLIWGMLFGTVLGTAMGKLNVGIAIGYFAAMVYYFKFSSLKGNDNKQE